MFSHQRDAREQRAKAGWKQELETGQLRLSRKAFAGGIPGGRPQTVVLGREN